LGYLLRQPKLVAGIRPATSLGCLNR